MDRSWAAAPMLITALSGISEYRLAQLRYIKVRKALYETATPKLQALLDSRGVRASYRLRLSYIGAEEINAWKGSWPESPFPDANFPWPTIVAKNRRNPRRFELAMWHGLTLCGLCMGVPSEGVRNLNIRFLEARPYDHPLRGYVALIAMSCADQFADYLGARAVRLRNPNPGAISKYESLGFRAAEPVQGTRFHVREVEI